MDKFYKEFYASRLEEWKNKYIKLLELRKLVKLIVNDIEKHGGKIERKNGRFSIIEDTRTSIQLDRHSVGLSVLEDKENLFNKNAPIFETPVMYEIENTFKEIEDLAYSDDTKIFLYFLNIEIHNVYVFYLSKEKEIFTRTNDHLYKKKNLEKMVEEEVFEELNDLTDIAYLTYSFYLYADLNIEALRQILKYFDEHFMSVNNNISLNKLYFNKYLSQNESDLKYILSFKIVVESTALLESYRKELIKLYPNNDKIKSQGKELNDVLVYLISKNTDRVNDEIYEVYIHANKAGGLIKQKKNVDIDIQNSFFIDIHKADDYLKNLEELQYDKKMKIKITCKNKINIFILIFYIFLNSIYYIIPYSSIYFNYKNISNENKQETEEVNNHFEFLGIILSSTHIGILISRFIYSCFSKFKNAYIFYCFCFLFSFIFIILSCFIDFEKNSSLIYLHTTLFSLSRFFLGLSNERIITRKYLILFIPESKMRYFSILFLLTSYLGLIIGAILIFFIDNIPKIIQNEVNEFLLYIIGFAAAFIILLIILFLFTEPNKDDEGNMLTQILNISEVTDDVEEDLLSDKKKEEKIYLNGKPESINDQSKDSGYLVLQENNLEINLEKELYDEKKKENENENDSIKNEDKVISKKELQGLNSIEKDIILMNQTNNFDDVNLVGNELERIKKVQINKNNSFIKSFLAFIITLFLCNMINEYILIKAPFLLEKITHEDIEDNKWIVATTFILLLLFSFPLIVFCRIIKKFDIERRLLLVIYIIILLILFGLGIYKYINPGQQKPLLLIIFIIYLLNNSLEGITHLLIEKIIPSFVKFCGIHMKYLFSYSIHIGKAFGGIIFFFIYFFLYKKENTNGKLLCLDNIESLFFISITFIFFIVSFICYRSLRVRAFAKLRYSE